VTGCCEHGDEPSGSIKCGVYLEELWNYFFFYFSRMQTLFYMSILGLKFNKVHII
jgi:hypothetical protein